MKNNLSILLKLALEDNQLVISESAQEKLLHYLQLMQSWNQVFNLTAITNSEEMIYLHLIDSLLVWPYLRGKQFLDMGSGAGLPGIPLAIMHPESRWTLIDKNNKKTRFLQQAVLELNLSTVTIIHKRLENFVPVLGFDRILSRAFGTLSHMVACTSSLLALDGEWLAMKGKYPAQELAELPKNIEVIAIVRLNMIGRNIERHLVILKQKKE